MKDHLAFRFTPEESHGQTAAQFASLGFIANGAVEAHAQNMQFRFGHGAFEPEQEPVVKQPGMVEAIQIADESVGHATQLQQPIPFGIVARDARGFQAEDDPDLAHGDLVGHLRKPASSDNA